jgi:tRNA G26 N,N-dimethylase Trm1
LDVTDENSSEVEALLNLESRVDPERESDLKQLLSYVRYPLMTKDYLIEIMKTNPLIKSTDFLTKLVVDALKVHGVSVSELNSPPSTVKSSSKTEAFRTKLRKSNQTKEL